MRRAVLVLFLALAAALLSTPAGAQRSDVIDGAGMVNYLQKPRFKIGDWVTYRVTGKSVLEGEVDYSVTILVGGEEVWWGEPCVWIETRTQRPGQREMTTASLVSYSAFGDTMAARQPMWFMRKVINGHLPDGRPDINLYSRDPAEVKMRRVTWETAIDPVKVDTLGTDTTTVPAGRFPVLKVKQLQLAGQTVESGDSSVFYERRIARIYHYSSRIPLTNLTKIAVDDIQQSKAWLAGSFDQGPPRVLEHGVGETVLVEYGSSGLTPLLVPESSRHPIDRKLIDQATSLPAETPTRTIRRPKSSGS